MISGSTETIKKGKRTDSERMTNSQTSGERQRQRQNNSKRERDRERERQRQRERELSGGEKKIMISGSTEMI